VHGYSLLRPQLNQEYFHALFDESVNFGIAIEGHRTRFDPPPAYTYSYFIMQIPKLGQVLPSPRVITRKLICLALYIGVYETALAYTNAARMADNAILFKLVAKSVGMKHGIMPSFMAKPWGTVGVSYP